MTDDRFLLSLVLRRVHIQGGQKFTRLYLKYDTTSTRLDFSISVIERKIGARRDRDRRTQKPIDQMLQTELENHQVRIGRGIKTRKYGFSNTDIFEIGLYIDPSIVPAFHAYSALRLSEFVQTEELYNELIRGEFHKSMVLVLLKDMTKSQTCDSIVENLRPRMTKDEPGLSQVEQALNSHGLGIGDRIVFNCETKSIVVLQIGDTYTEEIESKELVEAIFGTLRWRPPNDCAL